MKLETLAKRLADKTNTPELEHVILGDFDMSALPIHCMIWTGAKGGATPRKAPRVSRNSRDGLRVEQVEDRPYGIITWQGDRVSVHRLIFQLIQKPDYEFRMWCDCQSPLCVNPLHFTVEPVVQKTTEPDDTIYIGMDEEISDEEVEELVEITLTEGDPRHWGDVITYPLLEGIPPEAIRRALQKLNREHLT